jgi:hypothetical protein
VAASSFADRLIDRYRGTASRVVSYLGEDQIRNDDDALENWARVAAALRRPDGHGAAS